MLSLIYVDDEPGLLELGQLFLESTGDFSVVTATSGQEALDQLARHKFDAVISDYQMPEMDGIKLLKNVRKLYGTLPFILFTGRGREEVVIDAINNGVDFYLQKGGDPSAQFAELAHKIRQAVRRHSAETALAESRDYLNTIFASVKAGILVIDATTHIILDVNPAAAELISLTKEKIVGRICHQFLCPAEAGKCPITDLNRSVDNSEKILVTASGTQIPIIKYVTRVEFSGKACLLETFIDNTERKRAETELRSAYTSLKLNQEQLQAAYQQLAAAEEELHEQYDELARSEQLIRANEERLVTAQEIGHTGSWEYDVRTKMVWGSAEASRIFGFALGTTPRPRENIDACIVDAPRVRKALNDLITTGKEYNITYVINPADGSNAKTIHSRARLEKDAYGNPLKVVGVVHDITTQVQREEELRAANEQISATEEELRAQYDELANIQRQIEKQQQQLQDITSSLPGVVYQFYARPDGSMGLYYVSNQGPKVFGIGESIKNVSEFFELFTSHIDPRDRESFFSSIADAINAGAPWNFVGRFIKPSGEKIWFEGISQPVTHGTELRYSGILFDITERKKAEEQMRFLQISADRSTDEIFWLDFSGSILYVNEAACRNTGYSREEFTSMKLFELDPDFSPEIWEQSITDLRMRKTQFITTRHRRKNGSIMDVEIVAVYVNQDDREYSFAFVRDITDRKRSGTAISEVIRRFNLLNSITHHDISNQLTVAKSFVALAQHNKPEAVIGSLTRIENVIETIQWQIEFMRAYQDLGTHPAAWFSVNDLIQRARMGDIDVIVSCESVEIFADPMIERVFFNLFDNAIKYGERVTTISVGCERLGNSLVVAFADNGVGVPPTEKTRIFEKGYGKRSGLGLFLCREILSISGITITENGEFGKGARFEMTIPDGIYRLRRQ